MNSVMKLKDIIKESIEDIDFFKTSPSDDKLKTLRNVIQRELVEQVGFEEIVKDDVRCLWYRDEDGNVEFSVKVIFNKDFTRGMWSKKKHLILAFLYSSNVFHTEVNEDSVITLKLKMINKHLNEQD